MYSTNSSEKLQYDLTRVYSTKDTEKKFKNRGSGFFLIGVRVKHTIFYCSNFARINRLIKATVCRFLKIQHTQHRRLLRGAKDIARREVRPFFSSTFDRRSRFPFFRFGRAVYVARPTTGRHRTPGAKYRRRSVTGRQNRVLTVHVSPPSRC